MDDRDEWRQRVREFRHEMMIIMMMFYLIIYTLFFFYTEVLLTSGSSGESGYEVISWYNSSSGKGFIIMISEPTVFYHINRAHAETFEI